MKVRYLLISLINISLVHAQQIHLQGRIVDAQSNLPVAAATISFSAKRLVYFADNEGKFDITSGKVTGTDSVSFSCVGYKTKKVLAADISPNGITLLWPHINILREVQIGTNTSTLMKVGSKEKESKYSAITSPGGDMAAFMEGSKDIKGTIQTVGFFLSNGHDIYKGGNVTAPFRIKLFAVDTNGKPGMEMTKDTIIVSAQKNNEWFDVDLSAYHIANPDSGFFVTFSLLNIEHYKLKKGVKTTDEYGRPYETIDDLGVHHNLGAESRSDIITPRLGATLIGKSKPGSYFSTTTLQDMSWHWEPARANLSYRIYGDLSYLIRATIAPEK